MKLFKDTIKLLRNQKYFDDSLDSIYALALIIMVFFVIGFVYIFKPVILLYLLILGMLVMGWFMIALLFPDLFEKIQKVKRSILSVFK